MDLSSQLFFMELITTATGSMVLLLWQIFQKPFLRVNPKMVEDGIYYRSCGIADVFDSGWLSSDTAEHGGQLYQGKRDC